MQIWTLSRRWELACEFESYGNIVNSWGWIAKTIMVCFPPSSRPYETHLLGNRPQRQFYCQPLQHRGCGSASLSMPGAELHVHEHGGWLLPNVQTWSMAVNSQIWYPILSTYQHGVSTGLFLFSVSMNPCECFKFKNCAVLCILLIIIKLIEESHRSKSQALNTCLVVNFLTLK